MFKVDLRKSPEKSLSEAEWTWGGIIKEHFPSILAEKNDPQCNSVYGEFGSGDFWNVKRTVETRRLLV